MAFKLIAKGRNPSAGRHNIGAPIARSGIRPPDRTGSASGSYGVGTGRNQKTAARANYSGSQPKSSADAPAEDWINQSPTPWDNSQAASNPVTGAPPAGPSSSVGGMGGKTGVTGAMGSGGNGRAPRSREDDMAATGHPRGYQYKNLTPLNSGAKIKPPKENTGGGNFPQTTRKFRSNGDLFNEAYANFKKWGG